MRWLLLHYQPTTLFALKSSLATSTVGRSLIVPTPYAIKMAFVDAAFRAGWDEARCRQLVEHLVGVEVRIRPAPTSVVTQTIQKIRQEQRRERGGDELYIPTVAYREVVYVKGQWTWAFDVADRENLAKKLIELAPVIQYVGKRGSMLQFLGRNCADDIGREFSIPMKKLSGLELPERSHIAVLDDFGPEANFVYLNSFDPDHKPKRDVHRIFVDVLVPAGVANSGPGFVQYATAADVSCDALG